MSVGAPTAPNFPTIRFQQKEQMWEGGFSKDHKKECHPDVKGQGMWRKREDVGPRGLIPSGPPRGLPLKLGALEQEVSERVEEGR